MKKIVVLCLVAALMFGGSLTALTLGGAEVEEVLDDEFLYGTFHVQAFCDGEPTGVYKVMSCSGWSTKDLIELTLGLPAEFQSAYACQITNTVADSVGALPTVIAEIIADQAVEDIVEKARLYRIVGSSGMCLIINYPLRARPALEPMMKEAAEKQAELLALAAQI